jgi:hypothetical protein
MCGNKLIQEVNDQCNGIENNIVKNMNMIRGSVRVQYILAGYETDKHGKGQAKDGLDKPIWGGFVGGFAFAAGKKDCRDRGVGGA